MLYIYIYNDRQNVLNDLRNTAYWIVKNKTLNETAKGNFKNDVVPLMKTAGVVENSGHCIHSIGLRHFLNCLSLFHLVFYIYINIYKTQI